MLANKGVASGEEASPEPTQGVQETQGKQEIQKTYLAGLQHVPIFINDDRDVKEAEATAATAAESPDFVLQIFSPLPLPTTFLH